MDRHIREPLVIAGVPSQVKDNDDRAAPTPEGAGDRAGGRGARPGRHADLERDPGGRRPSASPAIETADAAADGDELTAQVRRYLDWIAVERGLSRNTV